MQLQKKEREMLAANETIEEQTIDLDPLPRPSNETEGILIEEKPPKKLKKKGKKTKMVYEEEVPPSPPPPLEEPEEELQVMDVETAKDLDDAVAPLPGTRESLTAGMQMLPLNPLYTSRRAKGDTSEPDLPLSRPEHYAVRIGRDRRHLAVSIAASTEQVSQWRLFCQEHGGLFPLLETVREGAQAIRQRDASDAAEEAFLGSRQEETFQAACSACRAVRDLCAISPEQAAVITDSLLRANAAWDGGLMEDFRTILQYAREYTAAEEKVPARKERFLLRRRNRRETRLRSKLYVTQLLLAMTVASDDAVTAIRSNKGLTDVILSCSSYAMKEQTRRWLRYPGELIKWLWLKRSHKDDAGSTERLGRPFIRAAIVANDLNGQVQRTSNQILAAIGYNFWVPKVPGQKGLRILCLDGGGSRGMTAVTAVNCLMESIGNDCDVSDAFDMIVGTSTGGIIAFLVGLQRESSAEAVERYKQLIGKIFVKTALSTPLMLFTTATYDESPFMKILSEILGEDSMLDSRADPTMPLVSCLTSKMSSTPTHVALFRNYNYAGGELADPFTIDPDAARAELGIPLDLEHELIRHTNYPRKKESTKSYLSYGTRTTTGSRHPGSFRVLQRYALRASTAAPTVFKPVMMGGEMYCDGGIVASNPAAVAIHEARSLFPDIPIELVVSVGTGGFLEQKSAPRIGWDGIIGQIVNSATDGEQVHHILEDVLGSSAVLGTKDTAVSKTRYFRFNPVIGLPEEFPIDVTDPEKLVKLRKITKDYMAEPEQIEKIDRIAKILTGRKGRTKRRRSAKRR
jgi:calcium-independent phospholipase A2-gamma